MKRWKILGKVKNQEIINLLLANRGLTTQEQITEFLNPKKPNILTPISLGIDQKELNKAVKRIEKAISAREQIIVYGDYDADGVCGTAILWETLDHLGAKALPYIPHRVEEGYGLSQKGIDNLLVHKPSLIITVDHGITAGKAVDYAQKKGVEVIITDHHQKSKIPPKSYATVWTDQICGAAVAWILAEELIKNSQLDNLKICNYLDLVAIATIADLLPLKGPNRSLVKFGLEELNKTQRPGLLALIEGAGLILGKIGVYEIGFILTPRLNASGRIEHALDSLRLLCTRNPQRGRILAQKLGQINQERQRLTEEALLHARGLVGDSSSLIFISHSSYNEGVIGLVAGRLADEFYRPTIVVSEGKIHSKASARSISGFNIIEALRKSEELLVDCGGHPMAAGFTAETIHLQTIKDRLSKIAQKEIAPDQLQKTLKIDCEVELPDINWPFYEEISKFAPFGNGNPEPVFLTRKAIIRDLRSVGAEGKHLKLLIDSPSKTPDSKFLSRNSFFSAIGFNLGDWTQKLKIGDQIDIVYTLLVDAWNGEEKLQLKIKDLQPSD